MSLVEDVEAVFENVAKLRVLVIGDSILDVYHHGKIKRLSPEGNEHLVEIDEVEFRAGGAANVANCVKALGCKVTLCTTIGTNWPVDKELDIFAPGVSLYYEEVEEFLNEEKHRVMVGNDCILRYDNPYSGDQHVGGASDYNWINGEDFDVIIASDYGKGFFDTERISALRSRKSVMILDPCVYTPDQLIEIADISTPNRSEFTKHNWPVRQTIVTDGKDGCFLPYHAPSNAFMNYGRIVRISSHRVNLNPYVCGCGDSFVSAMAVCFLARESSYKYLPHFIANVSGYLTSKNPFTAQPTSEEIIKEVGDWNGDMESLVQTEQSEL